MSLRANDINEDDYDVSAKLEFAENDQISKYLERMRENRGKDAMEIVEAIEKREMTRRG